MPPLSYHIQHPRLCNEGRSSRRVVLERWRDLLLGLVVASQTVDTGLDENETELRVLVLAVGLKMLANGNSLLHKVPEILRNLRGQACAYIVRILSYGGMTHVWRTLRLEDTQDLVTRDKSHLGNTVRVPEGDTDLRGGKTLAGEFDDVLNDVLGGRL